jgi:DNA sulfur modification protein DndD
LEELRLAEKELGATEAVLAAREEELATLKSQKAILEREQKKLLSEQANAAISLHRVELAGRVAQSLAMFEHRLLDRKLAQLRTEFVRHFNFLVRKADLVADIRIDPETFAATLVDSTGRAISKASLSAGEQQVYAIAMLWALAKTSGRPLPMIIDTPLARLDSEHRDNLLERYFPHASHQVVLLSTDTEITSSLLGHLGRKVSHAFTLDYDSARSCTTVSSGYFEDVDQTHVRGRRHAV